MSFIFILLLVMMPNHASAETRTLKMYYAHSKESATITFKRNGRYVKGGLRKANRFLRDWRRKEPTRMDPALLDLVWEVYQRSGSRKPIQVISGYRSPRTNNMLRRRGRKVARHSQHTKGKALDFFLPDVSVKKLRALGLKAHRGGVGYYRGSFVHLDTGRVRHWPRMSRRQLARVFPRGKTIHVPSNGRRLRGYKVAMANLKKGLNANGRRRTTKVRGSLLARIFKGGGSRGEENNNAVVIAKVQKKIKKPTVAIAKVKPVKPVAKPVAKPVRIKEKGIDPFSQESLAAAKVNQKRLAEEKRKTKEAELAAKKAKEQEQKNKKLADKALAIAKAKDKSVAKAKATAIALAKTKAQQLARKVAESALVAKLAPAAELAPAEISAVVVPTRRPELSSGTQLALAPVAEPTALKPKVLSADQATQLALASPKSTITGEPIEVEKLNSRTLALLSRQRKLLSAQKSLLKLPVPKRAVRKAEKELLVAALTPESAAKPKELKDKVLTDAARVPIPKNPSLKNSDEIRSADPKLAIQTGVSGQMKSELKLGNLDGRSVKVWAVASSTRVGLSARLRAPIYKRSTSRAAPASVFSVGFAFKRSPLRADRFSGRALTRVAFAHFGYRE
ncbi:MAG: DUF882 domain-containing protein [Rhizobiaceae bacterium]